ncbi:hypothetical protein GCM10020221_36070 [Streptomyces thioluteus]|uniref:WYL domain-containing protein n=1 Tax=Streptomyces thioluteus TaxID=66431 RepID=A0ABP6JNL9_STRTU
MFVLVAQSAHSALGLDRARASALRKMMAALPAPHRPAAELASRRVLIDPDRWLAGPRGAAGLEALHSAAVADRRVRIAYRHSGSTRLDSYLVDPYGLASKAGVWYLVADERGAPRLFHADRLADFTVTDEPVRRRDGVELADVWEELRRGMEDRSTGVRVLVRVRQYRLDMLQRITGPSFLGLSQDDGASGDGEGPAPDAWRTAELVYPVTGAVCQLLQFGADVEVVSPPGAVREMSLAVARLAALYPPPEPVESPSL